MTVRGNAAAILRRMKGISGLRGLRFPIRDANLNIIGYLRGFDGFCLADTPLIETMARFRTFYSENFLLGCEKCVVEIFKSNVIVVDNSLHAGFTMEKEFHLRVERKDGMVSYFKEEDANLVNTDAILLSLGLGKGRFAEMNRSVVENPCWSREYCGEELVCD